MLPSVVAVAARAPLLRIGNIESYRLMRRSRGPVTTGWRRRPSPPTVLQVIELRQSPYATVQGTFDLF